MFRAIPLQQLFYLRRSELTRRFAVDRDKQVTDFDSGFRSRRLFSDTFDFLDATVLTF
jgi:hypothetical protein